MENIKKALSELNNLTKELGLFRIEILNPKDLVPQQLNARYFTPEKFKQLVENVSKEGALESLPLVMETDVPDKYEIISGHHRIEGAIEAGLTQIMVMVTKKLTKDELISKQLAHNALVGIDDKAILNELLQSIRDIEMKIATGLSDEIGKISYDSINFRVGNFKEIMIMFLPEEEEHIEKVMEQIVSESMANIHQTVYLTQMNYYDKFAKLLRKVKRIDNIKNNGVAFLRLVELAEEQLKVINKESQSNGNNIQQGGKKAVPSNT